ALLAVSELVARGHALGGRADRDRDLLVRLEDQVGWVAGLLLAVEPPLQVVAAALEAPETLRREADAPDAEELPELEFDVVARLDVDDAVRDVRVQLGEL